MPYTTHTQCPHHPSTSGSKCSLALSTLGKSYLKRGVVEKCSREISLTRRHTDRHTEMGGGGLWDSLKPINQNEHITTQNADQKLKIFNLSAFKPISCRATAAKLNHHHCGEGVVYIYKDICVCLRGLLWGLKYIWHMQLKMNKRCRGSWGISSAFVAECLGWH